MGVSTFTGHSWGIRRVFMGYTYVSGMCRVCIGCVSGTCRYIKSAWRFEESLKKLKKIKKKD